MRSYPERNSIVRTCGVVIAKDRWNLDPPTVGKCAPNRSMLDASLSKSSSLRMVEENSSTTPIGLTAKFPGHVSNEPRKIQQNGEIELHDFLNVRPLNFDCYLGTVW